MKKDRYEQSIIDLIFADFGPRPLAKISVRRVEPEWCAGYLGTFDIEDPHEFPSEMIRSRFGGLKFHVKIRDGYGRYRQHRTISICEVPRLNGLPISPEKDTDPS